MPLFFFSWAIKQRCYDNSEVHNFRTECLLILKLWQAHNVGKRSLFNQLYIVT